MKTPNLLASLHPTIENILSLEIPQERRRVLDMVVDYVRKKRQSGADVNLNFICTHNSRRSQLSQVWAQVAAYSFEIPLQSYSGGVEVTAFNERAVKTLERDGFIIEPEGGDNPHYKVTYAQDVPPLVCFSKTFDDPANPTENFAAIMTCSDADENCPFIPGAEARIPLRYDDPKEFDNTALEQEKYQERSHQIASEMFYIFSRVAQ